LTFASARPTQSAILNPQSSTLHPASRSSCLPPRPPEQRLYQRFRAADMAAVYEHLDTVLWPVNAPIAVARTYAWLLSVLLVRLGSLCRMPLCHCPAAGCSPPAVAADSAATPWLRDLPRVLSAVASFV
jgi:hypothetical protein